MEAKFTFQSNDEALFKKDEEKDDGLMKFTVMGYTGGVMESGYGSVAIDLEGMKFRNDVTPMFQHHDSTRIVGHADKKTITPHGLELNGVISGTGEAAQEVISTSANGFPWQASVGVSILSHKLVAEKEEYEVNGQTMKGPGVVLCQTEVFETSFVPLGRDKNTSSALFSEDFELELQQNKEQIMENETKGVEPVQEEVNVISEMRAAFPNDAEFALDAVERGISVLEAKAEFADKVVKERDDLAIELAELQASLEKEECDGEVPVEYQEEVHEQFEADSPQAEFNRLRKEAKAQHAFSDQEAFNHVAENNPELADKLI